MIGLLVFQSCSNLKSKTITPPWHLVDIWYTIEPPKNFQSLSIDFEISEDIPSNCQLYIAPLGSGKLNNKRFYGGIQTNTGGFKDKYHIKNNSPKTFIGRSIIFSRWKERSPDAIEIANGGVCESGGYEGDFISVRNSYSWDKGKYKITLFNSHKEVNVNDTLHTLVGMKIYSYQNNTNQIAGYLAFPSNEITLSERLAIFVEIYGKQISLSETPKCKIEFSNIQINEINQVPKTITAYYPIKFPQWSNAVWENEKIIVEIGKPFERINYTKTEYNYSFKMK